MDTGTRTDPTVQGSLPTITMIRPGDMSCPGQPILSECIRAGQEAWQRLSSGHTRQDWLLVGKACQLLRVEAMRAAHTNRPKGRRYSQEFSDLLKANGFDAIDKSTRSRLFHILDNVDAVEKWVATVPASKRLELNHPHTIWRAYQKTVDKTYDDGKKPSHVEKLKTSLIESQEENAKLKCEVERGSPFTRQDTARDIAGVVFRMISPSKAREVARELNRLARETAEAWT
ncbi:MAG: hypothetical protein WA625_19315 [Pseudolabrys sp.]